MISIEDIIGIDNTDLYTYEEYTSAGYIHYPVNTDSISFGSLSLLRTKLSINNTRVLNPKDMIEDHLEDNDLFLMCNYLQYGDYDNSCMVERSNYKLFLESFGGLSFVFKVYGGYGSSGIAISVKGLLNPDNEEKAEEIIELLNDLNKYPCIDDEDMSNMEYDSFIKSLNDFGLNDSMTALSKKFNLEVYDYDEEKLKEVLLESDRNLNYPSYMIESGGSCHIDIDRLIEPIAIDTFKSVLKDFEVKA